MYFNFETFARDNLFIFPILPLHTICCFTKLSFYLSFALPGFCFVVLLVCKEKLEEFLLCRHHRSKNYHKTLFESWKRRISHLAANFPSFFPWGEDEKFLGILKNFFSFRRFFYRKSERRKTLPIFISFVRPRKVPQVIPKRTRDPFSRARRFEAM
jgi:hypothetical protein